MFVIEVQTQKIIRLNYLILYVWFQARFSGLCLRFADDFETSLDDWKPDPSQPQMNLCVVSEGTYEVCSRTLAAQKIDSGIFYFYQILYTWLIKILSSLNSIIFGAVYWVET